MNFFLFVLLLDIAFIYKYVNKLTDFIKNVGRVETHYKKIQIK
jgi:hypothetical protein